MRLAEIVLLGAALPLGIGLLAAKRDGGWLARIWGLIVLVALAVHLKVEGLYWQMATAYVACALLWAVVFVGKRWPPFFRRVAGGLSLVLLLASAAALFVLPKFRLPKPTGPYAVGTRILHFEDASRPDPAFTSGHRELMVQVWYPADASKAPLAVYRRAVETTWLSSYDAALTTHSRLDAPILRSSGALPILLFNPAWQGQRTQNTFQTEELASHGYLVIAIDHTHNSEPVAFPNGKIFASSEIRDIEDFTGVNLDGQVEYGTAEATTEAKDDSVVLDAFSAMNNDASSPWYRSLDLARVGALGHSFGGSVSVEAAFRDSRIQAALNMDGWIFGDLWQRNLDKPLMLIYEDPYPPATKTIQAGLNSSDRDTRLITQLNVADMANVNRTLTQCGGYLLNILGTKHFNFSDRALYSPVRRLTESGPIAPYRAYEIINRYTLAFFDQALHHSDEPLLVGNSPFPEVHFEHHSKGRECAALSNSPPSKTVGSSE